MLYAGMHGVIRLLEAAVMSGRCTSELFIAVVFLEALRSEAVCILP